MMLEGMSTIRTHHTTVYKERGAQLLQVAGLIRRATSKAQTLQRDHPDILSSPTSSRVSATTCGVCFRYSITVDAGGVDF